MNEALTVVLVDLGYVVTAFILLLIAKVTLDVVTPYKLDDQLSAKDNPAVGLSLIGYYLGVCIVFIGATFGEGAADAAIEAGEMPGMDYVRELGIDAAWALGGIVLLNISRLILDKVVLRRFSTRKEIVEDKNVGMGAVEFGTYVASALVVAGAISGEGGGIETALAFWGLGQVAMIVFSFIYQALTPYDFHEQLEKDNVAAGVALGGNLIAMGVLMMAGVAGDFVGWQENLTRFGWLALAAVVLLAVGRFVIDGVLLPGADLKTEIAADRNVNAGFLEGGLLVGLASVIFFTVI